MKKLIITIFLIGCGGKELNYLDSADASDASIDVKVFDASPSNDINIASACDASRECCVPCEAPEFCYKFDGERNARCATFCIDFYSPCDGECLDVSDSGWEYAICKKRKK